jgi:hypothetical protein
MKKLLFGLLLLVAVNANAWTNFTFTVEDEIRVKTEGGFYYNHTDLKLAYSMTPWMDVFGGYRLVFQDPGDGFDNWNKFLPGVTLKTPEGSWGKLSLRSQFEFGLAPKDIDNTYELSEKLKYNTPWKWTKLEINPFVADEVFFDADRGMDFDKNRAFGGFDYKITQHLKGSVFYFYESAKGGGKWDDAHVIGTSLRFEF